MVERCMELRNASGRIIIGCDEAAWNEKPRARDKLETTTLVMYNTDVRRVNVTLDLDKAKDLIELLQEYIEYRTVNPQEVRE